MKKTVLDKVPRILREKLDRSKNYVAAVSGGADSLAMADALQRCGFRFTVCHVEHGIRGRESLEDARYVEAFCRKMGIAFCCKAVDAQKLRENEKMSLEDAARRLRYQALFQCAEESGIASSSFPDSCRIAAVLYRQGDCLAGGFVKRRLALYA